MLKFSEDIGFFTSQILVITVFTTWTHLYIVTFWHEICWFLIVFLSVRPYYCYYPFALGPRTCLGQVFSQVMKHTTHTHNCTSLSPSEFLDIQNMQANVLYSFRCLIDTCFPSAKFAVILTALLSFYIQMEAKVVLAKLLQRFEFSLVPGQSFDIKDTGTLRPKSGVICYIKHCS